VDELRLSDESCILVEGARTTIKQRDRYKGSKESLGEETNALDPDEHFGVIALMLGPPASCCVCFIIFSMYTFYVDFS
jgi:hypothetical protein